MLGCTDTLACNYDMDANTDDDSCLIVGNSCDDLDDITINDIINDSCVCAGELIVLGCTDTLACNYDMDANTDDGSCLTLDCNGDCGGTAELDALGVCGGTCL